MPRYVLGLVALVALCSFTLVAAEDKKDTAKNGSKATITKVDAKTHTITVKMKDKNGKEVEKEFKLAEDVRYFDSTGKVAAMDIFQSGNDILVVEEEGKVKEIRQDKGKTTKPEEKKDK